MSVLIKGAKMPKACCECPCFEDYGYCNALENDAPIDDNIRYDCPLVEISPHGRLIDADVFEEMLNSEGGVELKDVPTVIESEEQEHE